MPKILKGTATGVILDQTAPGGFRNFKVEAHWNAPPPDMMPGVQEKAKEWDEDQAAKRLLKDVDVDDAPEQGST